LIDRSKGTSGEVLRVITLRAASTVMVVRRAGGSSSRSQPSSTGTAACRSNRPLRFDAAPRALRVAPGRMWRSFSMRGSLEHNENERESPRAVPPAPAEGRSRRAGRRFARRNLAGFVARG
jgi:hypothetical protein